MSFRIYNYAEFYNVVTYEADARGNAALDTGLGDMFVLAWKGSRFGYGVATGEHLTIELNHRFGEAFADSLTVVPPPENPLVSEVTDEQQALNARRMAAEDSIRLSHDHRNHALERFASAHPDRADAVIGLLSEKDRADVKYDVLEDALLGTGSQRVELEPLRPYRQEILSSGEVDGLSSPARVMAWCQEHITVDNSRNPQNLRTAPVAVWRHRQADSLGFKIFYVALCRTLGLDAAYDPVTGKIDRSAPQTLLRPASDQYFRDYTLSAFSPAGTTLMDYESGLPEILSLDEGYYLLTTGRRLADGSVLVRLEFFPLKGGEERDLVPVVREAGEKPSVIGTMNADSLLPLTGRGYFLLAVMGHGDEPTSHARAELEAAAPLLERWGRPVVYADESVLSLLPPPHQLPVIVIADSFGRIVYQSAGYNTSLAADLERIIPHL